MTLKEFSKKYEVKYGVVYAASYLVKPISTMQRDRDFPEEELYRQVTKELHRRAVKYTELAKDCRSAYQRIRQNHAKYKA